MHCFIQRVQELPNRDGTGEMRMLSYLIKRHSQSIMIKTITEISFHVLCIFSDTSQRSFQTKKAESYDRLKYNGSIPS